MRRSMVILTVLATLLAATPAWAHSRAVLDGPDPAIWLSDPDGVDGDAGTEQGDPVLGARGRAVVTEHGARIVVRATGLEPDHVYTMWVVYFNDSSLCVDGCNGPDLAVAGAGSIWGDGAIANASGKATLTTRLRNGAGAESVGDTPPPPFAFAPYETGPNNEFHVVVRSHGPQIPGEVEAQLSSFGGGCTVNVGPAPEEVGDFPVPAAPGECGEIQLYVFR